MQKKKGGKIFTEIIILIQNHENHKAVELTNFVLRLNEFEIAYMEY